MADDGVAAAKAYLQTAKRPRLGQRQRHQQAAAKPAVARVGLVVGTSLNSPADVADVLLRLKRIGVVGSTALAFAETCDVALVHSISDAMLVALVGGALPTLPEFPGEGVPLGLPGALSPTRWVGGTAGGPPTTGKFKTGDWVTAPDGIWYCSSGDGAGLGTWQNSSTLAASPDASTSLKGILKLAGDLAGTADVPTVPGLAAKAPLASPALTGTPTAPTAAPGTNTTQLATAAFVQAAVAALLNGAPGALDTLKELADAIGDDASFAATITTALALKAPLASPALTGNPTAPTPSAGDNDTSIATTAFVAGGFEPLPVVGTLAAQPLAATFGKGFYFATDDNGGTLYYSNGTTWQKQGAGVGQAATPALVAGPTFITSTTPAAGTTSTAYIDLVGMGTPAFTAVAGKSYKVFSVLQPGNVVSGHQTTVAICNASDSSVIREQGYVARAANDSFQIILADIVVPGAVSYSAKVRIKTDSGGTAFDLAGATFRSVIWIEQVN